MTKSERIQWLKDATVKQRRDYYGKVKSMPCVACGAFGPSDAHHCYSNKFPATRDWRPVIPLCKRCHQGQPGGIHDGKKSWEEFYGSQDELLLATEKRLI